MGAPRQLQRLRSVDFFVRQIRVDKASMSESKTYRDMVMYVDVGQMIMIALSI